MQHKKRAYITEFSTFSGAKIIASKYFDIRRDTNAPQALKYEVDDECGSRRIIHGLMYALYDG